MLIFEGQSSVNVTSLKRFRGYNRSKSGIFSYFLIHVCWFIPPRIINVQYNFTKTLEFDTNRFMVKEECLYATHIKQMSFSNN